MMHSVMHKRQPAERFYWALLDASELGGRPSTEQMGYLFESVLPCPIEEIHAVYANTGKHNFVACGMRRTVLEEQSVGAFTLCPEDVPPFLGQDIVDTGRLNLLVGAFEPLAMRRLRRSFFVQAVLFVLILSAVMTCGLELRTSDHRWQAAELYSARSGLYEHVLGPAPAASNAPPEVRMTAELRRLRQTRAQPIQVAGDTWHDDVAVTLARLLARWPSGEEEVYFQAEHISVTPAAISLRGALPGSAEAEAFASRFESLDGWRLQQPQVTSARESVQASLHFAPRKEASP